MAEINLASSSQVDTSADNVVIIENFENIHGGKSLNAAAHVGDVIPAGTVIIVETSTGEHKPNPQTTPGTYDALPGGHTYAGILVASVLKTKPFASIMVRGTVDQTAATTLHSLPPYLTAMKNALSLIRFV